MSKQPHGKLYIQKTTSGQHDIHTISSTCETRSHNDIVIAKYKFCNNEIYGRYSDFLSHMYG